MDSMDALLVLLDQCGLDPHGCGTLASSQHGKGQGAARPGPKSSLASRLEPGRARRWLDSRHAAFQACSMP